MLLANADSSWCAKEVGGDWTWFGLWDLAAASGTGLLATAAAHPVEPGAMELCAYALVAEQPWPALGDRLVREVANHLRADGVDRSGLQAGGSPRYVSCCAAPGSAGQTHAYGRGGPIRCPDVPGALGGLDNS